MICTWNRAALLDATLGRMLSLEVPASVRWELIVVNNNCSDHTDAVITAHSARLPIRRVFEARPGLSNARNAALRVCRSEVIVWTDDDVLVSPGWLSAYAEAARDFAGASYFGGLVAPWFEAPPPKWIAENLDLLWGPFAVVDYGPERRWLRRGEVPVGANMAFRLSALEGRNFNVGLGHVGGRVRGGEELELVTHLVDNGHRGVWVPSAAVQHWIASERLSARYIREWYVGAGQALRNDPVGRDAAQLFGAPRWAVRRYATARLRSMLLRPLSSRGWLQATIDGARAWGVISSGRSKQVL